MGQMTQPTVSNHEPEQLYSFSVLLAFLSIYIVPIDQFAFIWALHLYFLKQRVLALPPTAVDASRFITSRANPISVRVSRLSQGFVSPLDIIFYLFRPC